MPKPNGKTAWIMVAIALVGILSGAIYAFASVNGQANQNKDASVELRPAVEVIREDITDIKVDVREALTILREREKEKDVEG